MQLYLILVFDVISRAFDGRKWCLLVTFQLDQKILFVTINAKVDVSKSSNTIQLSLLYCINLNTNFKIIKSICIIMRNGIDTLKFSKSSDQNKHYIQRYIKNCTEENSYIK